MLEQLGDYIEHAPILAVGLAFIGGMLTSFTPCVYPVIPITIGVIGARGATSKLHAFFVSFIYVLGLALMYATFGMIAALTGLFFGQISVHPVTNIIVGLICIIFALNMFDVFQIPIPQFLAKGNIGEKKQKGVFGVFIMGATSGSIVAPCTAPVLGTLLTFVSTTQNLIYGFVLLFSFAMGLGVLLIVVGVFSGLVAALPKSGVWMVFVKRLLGGGMVIIGMLFFLRAAGML